MSRGSWPGMGIDELTDVGEMPRSPATADGPAHQLAATGPRLYLYQTDAVVPALWCR